MCRLIVIVLAILLALVAPAAVTAQESVTGVITGQVINGTEGGSSVSGVEVTLITYVDNVMTRTETTTTDSAGQFRFDNISLDSEYLVSAKYMGVDYYYQVIFEEGETTAAIDVPVCDATDSDEAIRIGMAHTIIEVTADGILVTEYLWLVNDGDRTYVGTDGVLVFSMPEGATEFGAPAELMPDYQFLDNHRLSYLVPFPPGERQLAYYYQLPGSDSGELTIPLGVDYPTDNYELLVAGENIEVAVARLAPAEPVVADSGERYIHFQGENMGRGTVLEVHIYTSSGENRLLFLIMGGVAVLAIIGIAVYLVKRRGQGNKDA
jgi:hypothetical protein